MHSNTPRGSELAIAKRPASGRIESMPASETAVFRRRRIEGVYRVSGDSLAEVGQTGVRVLVRRCGIDRPNGSARVGSRSTGCARPSSLFTAVLLMSAELLSVAARVQGSRRHSESSCTTQAAAVGHPSSCSLSIAQGYRGDDPRPPLRSGARPAAPPVDRVYRDSVGASP